ncbi:alpha/beta fold hydrolase [Kribbella sp. NPDC048928]|uniref:alpha/beta fold hydrolase n=1 Tax=Kribbella sp. NPDC048928 TaxID=3364111 RepID=UPI00371BE6C8
MIFVLVHGAWHGPSAWDRVVPLLHAAGAHTVTPDLGTHPDRGLHDDAATVIATLDNLTGDDEVVLVGHSYAGLVVREAADARPDRVRQVVLIDGWAGPDGASLFDLAPDSFEEAVRAAAARIGDGSPVPAPPPAAFGVVNPADAAWLTERLVAQPLRTFAESTRLSPAVADIPGVAICCTPPTYDFASFGQSAGYRTVPIEGAHNIMLTDPAQLTQSLLTTSGFLQEQEVPGLR